MMFGKNSSGPLRLLAVLALGAAGVVLANVLNLSFIFNPAGKLMAWVIQPAVRAQSAAADWGRGVFFARDYVLRAKETEKQLRVLMRENVQLKELERENVRLRQELDFFERSQRPLTVARVVGSIEENGITFFIVNKGADEAVTRDAPVLVDGVIIGKITKVSKHTAVVVPLYAPQLKLAATFPALEETSGIIEGLTSGGYLMRLIPKDATVREGMTVITSGLELSIPRGLIVGTVERVEFSAEDLYQQAFVSSPVRGEGISLVGILKPIDSGSADSLE